VAYNASATPAAQLTGIPTSGAGAIRYAIARGDPVNLLVMEQDLAAQSALAALIGGDGVQEDHVSDNRLSATEARARARAWLAMRKDVEIAVRCVTRDLNMRSGRTLTVNLPLYGLTNVAFVIQSVTENAFTPALLPHFAAQASSVRFTFEDYLRMLKEGKI
jgi:hypothetical protein